MKKLLLLFTVCLLSFCSVHAQLPAVYKARLQFVFDSVCTVYNLHGATAAVVVPNLGAWKGTYGVSQAGVPLDSNMLCGIGSNTKTYIAATLLKLQEQSMVDLDDTIGTWIQHPNISGQITIRQLLNHTSGIYSYTSAPDFDDSLIADFNRVWQPEEILQFVGAPVFSPGTSWDYSNSNYLVAGIIIKNIMSQPLSTTLRNLILTPHGLQNTILFPDESTTAVIARPWSDNFNGLYLQDLIADWGYSNTAMFSMAWAAGAIMSTAEDNALFWTKLLAGQIISNASFGEMKQCIALNSTTGYGLGIFRYKNFNGRIVYSHGGTNLGYINENIADSVSGVAISVLTNQDSISNNILLTKLVSALHKVTINPPTALQYLAANAPSVIMYPNPAHDRLHVSGVGKGTLRLYDIAGREVFVSALQNGAALSLPLLTRGSYAARVTDAEGLPIYNGLLNVE